MMLDNCAARKVLKSHNWSTLNRVRKQNPCTTYLNRSTLEGYICLDLFNSLLWGFISTEAWMHGDIFISVQWGFVIGLTCKIHHSEQWNSTLNLHWHNRSSPNCLHYWLVISFIGPVPSGSSLGLPTSPVCGVCKDPQKKPQYGIEMLSARQQNNAANLVVV